jgi:hypothetical protein
VRKHALEIVERAPGDQNQAPAAPLELVESLAGARVDDAVVRDRAVVIGDEREEVQDRLLGSTIAVFPESPRRLLTQRC